MTVIHGLFEALRCRESDKEANCRFSGKIYRSRKEVLAPIHALAADFSIVCYLSGITKTRESWLGVGK